MIASYEADADKVAPLLPEGVTPADDPVACTAWGCEFPFTTYGPYRESFVFVRVRFGGEPYLYIPLIWVTSDAAMAAGREIWGFPKELADISVNTENNQLITTTERPAGRRIMTLSTTVDRPADPGEELDDLPVLLLRKIPNSRPDAPPSVCELTRTEPAFIPHRTATGDPDFWAGRASLTMDSRSEVDPIHAFAPVRIGSGYYGTFDMTLPYGEPIHDYLATGR